jgi:hypothetical protein
MEEIIYILMNRDGITYDEAKEMYLDTKSELMDVFEGTSVLTAEEVLMGELGLEEDYIFNFI